MNCVELGRRYPQASAERPDARLMPWVASPDGGSKRAEAPCRSTKSVLNLSERGYSTPAKLVMHQSDDRGHSQRRHLPLIL
jgi:hypothetical protein